jgi:hypothetical protein
MMLGDVHSIGPWDTRAKPGLDGDRENMVLEGHQTGAWLETESSEFDCFNVKDLIDIINRVLVPVVVVPLQIQGKTRKNHILPCQFAERHLQFTQAGTCWRASSGFRISKIS